MEIETSLEIVVLIDCHIEPSFRYHQEPCIVSFSLQVSFSLLLCAVDKSICDQPLQDI